jgi:hypothetical protein
MLNLYWPDIEAISAMKYVQKKLGGLGYHADTSIGVKIAIDAEVRDGIEIKEARAGHKKEVAQHAVRLPYLGEVRKAVEYVKRFTPGRLNYRMHLIDKGFETVLWLEENGFGLIKKRRVIGETEIDQPSLLDLRGLGIGFDQCQIFVERFDLPDNIVTTLDPGENGIESRQTGGRRKGWIHSGNGVLIIGLALSR